MGKHFEIKDIDKGFIRILGELKKLENKPYVKAGIQGELAEITYDTPVTTLQVGVYNEFGTDRIPERAFIRSTYDVHVQEWKALVNRLWNGIYKGLKVEQALDLLGLRMQKDIQDRIRHSPDWAKANAESTYIRKAEKGESPEGVKPLIDTGQLLNSITYKKVMVNEG